MTRMSNPRQKRAHPVPDVPQPDDTDGLAHQLYA